MENENILTMGCTWFTEDYVLKWNELPKQWTFISYKWGFECHQKTKQAQCSKTTLTTIHIKYTFIAANQPLLSSVSRWG